MKHKNAATRLGLSLVMVTGVFGGCSAGRNVVDEVSLRRAADGSESQAKQAVAAKTRAEASEAEIARTVAELRAVRSSFAR